MEFAIKHRFTGAVVFTAKLECSEDAPYSLQMGLAVKAALAAKANLSWADLSEANLSWADLSEANLSKADLSWADLSEANLSWANLSEADLRYIKHDIWGILLNAIPEVPALRAAIVDGRVDGSTYAGACACLCGTIANQRGCDVYNADVMKGIKPDVDSMAERFFLGIRKGDTPETNAASKMVLQWVDEFIALLSKNGVQQFQPNRHGIDPFGKEPEAQGTDGSNQ